MKYQAYVEYKDSGVEWLGEIPGHWNARQLKFLCSYNDEVLSDSVNADYEIEYVDIGSVFANEGITKTENMVFGEAPSRARRIVRDGDVIVSTVRTYLEAIAPITNPTDNLVVSTGFAVIRPNNYLNKGYAAYCLRASGFIKEVVARSVGVSYPAINASDLVNIKAPVPFFEEQKAIANFLDHETAKIDTLIEKQQQLIKLLKEKCQAVISHAVTKGLNPNAPMRDSGVEWLGEVPEQWKVSTIGHCAFVTKLTGFEYTNLWRTSGDGEIIALRGFNIKERLLDLYETERISLDLSKKLERSKLSKGDIVFPCTGTIGNAALIEIDNQFHINQNIAKISFNEEVVPKFAVYWLTSSFVRTIIDKNNTSGMQPVVLIGDIRKLPMPRMSLKEQESIAAYLDIQIRKFNKIINKAEQAIVWMQERRTALISAAVTGKIDVRNYPATGV